MDQGNNPGIDVVGIEGQIMVHRYMYLLGITILFWDHIITFGDEVKYIWTRPKILSSYCFIFSRYLALVGTIPVTVVKFSRMTTNACLRYYSYWIIWNTLRTMVVYASLCWRIYALYERSRRILVIMVVTNLLFTGVTLWVSLDRGTVPMELHLEGCVILVPVDPIFQRIIPWILAIIFESFIFSLTLWKSWLMKHYHGFNVQGSDPLIALLFRDSAVYYVFMLLSGLAGLITYYCSGAYTTEPLLTFTFNFSGIMVSRMILNLHKSVDKGILSPQRLIDIDFVSTMPWSESRDLELETVSSLRRRNGRASRSIILDDEILQIERDN